MVSCATVDRRQGLDFGYRGLQDGDPLLASAALAAEYVPDIYASTFLLTRIAEEYLKQGNLDLAKEVLRRAVLLSKKPGAAPNRYQLQTELGRFYISLNDLKSAHQMFQNALDQILTLTNEDLRGAALEAIIEQAFQSPEDFADILRPSIDYIYVLQDPIKRVDRLVKLGGKYQDLNIRNRANNLIQQAIAAASSINNPWEKARAYIQIARRFLAEGNTTTANQYISQALEVINSVEVLTISLDDADVLLDAIVNLADTGHLREASATVAILPNNQYRANAQLAIIERSIAQKADLQTRLLVQRLLNQLAQQDPLNQNELSLASLTKLAEIFQAANHTEESLRYAQSAMPYLTSPLISDTSAFRARIAIVMAQDGQIDNAIASAGLITDAWIGSQTLRQIAELSYQSKEAITKNRSNSIRALLIEAEQLAGTATYLRESALADVAISSFRTGDDIRAIRILQDVNDAYLLGKTLVDAASGRPTGIPLNSDARKKLGVLWTRLLAKPPSVH